MSLLGRIIPNAVACATSGAALSLFVSSCGGDDFTQREDSGSERDAAGDVSSDGQGGQGNQGGQAGGSSPDAQPDVHDAGQSDGATCCTPVNGTCDADCELSCDAGYADCNGEPEDGCEVDLQATAQRVCGDECIPAQTCCTALECINPPGPLACFDATCSAAGSTCSYATKFGAVVCGDACCNPVNAACTSDCSVACALGFADCNGQSADGCEVSLTATNQKLCGSTCVPAQTCCSNADCNNPPGPSGCYLSNCSGVGGTCSYALAPGTVLCGNVCCNPINGTCNDSCALACSSGFGNCNAEPGDGCETDVATTNQRACNDGNLCVLASGCCAAGDCPGASASTANVTCSLNQCDLSCRGENYDSNDDPADGCEVTDSPLNNHALAQATFLGTFPCDDGASAQSIAGIIPSDARAHEPNFSGFNGTTGSAPDRFYLIADGGLCVNDVALTLSITGSSGGVCYRLSVQTNVATYTCQTSTSCTISRGASSYGDDTRIDLIVEKICTTAVTETVSYTVSGHL